MMDVNEIRRQFPVLDQQVYGKPLVYLDNAATTQKPLCVIERERDYYLHENCNIHRGVHYLSQMATEAYEHARRTVARFINAKEAHEIVFTRGTTESLNLLATSLGTENGKRKTENGKLSVFRSPFSVLITAMEHHSNLVPWQQMVQLYGGKLLVAPMDDNGVLDLQAYEDLLKQGPQIVAMAHVSNTLGTVNPVKEMIRLAHQYGAITVVDGAQSMAHLPIDVQDLDCDFFVFSGHKMYAPMGIGGLYGKTELLEKMPPYQFGGEMVDTVSFEKTTFNKLPFKFEAGTPNVADAIGLGAALDYVRHIGIHNIEQHEHWLTEYAREQLGLIHGLTILGNPKKALWKMSIPLIISLFITSLYSVIDAIW